MIKLNQSFLDKVLHAAQKGGAVLLDENGGWRLKFDALTINLIGHGHLRIGLSYKGEQVGNWEQTFLLSEGYEELTISGLEGSVPFAISPA